jgi:hypothetical protein
VFLLALATRLPHLDHVPHKDELNHVLAARALLERGTLEIVAGAAPYDRAWGSRTSLPEYSGFSARVW